MKSKLRAWKIAGLAILAIIVIFIVSPYIPAVRYWNADGIQRVGLDTEYKLAAYERSGNPAEMRDWITNGPKEALMQESYIVLGQWSITHQSEFVRLAESLDKRQQVDFVEKFGFVLADSGQSTKFCTAFRASKSKVVCAIVRRCEPEQ